MSFRVGSVKIEITGNVEFSGDMNPYTDDSDITIPIPLPIDHPLVQELLDWNRERLLAELRTTPAGDLFG